MENFALVRDMVLLMTTSTMAGAFLGGFIFSLGSKVWTRIADRMAEKLDAQRAEQVLRLKAECWRLRARASKGGR